MDKKPTNPLKNDVALKEIKLPTNLESNKNVKTLNDEIGNSFIKSPRKNDLKLVTPNSDNNNINNTTISPISPTRSTTGSIAKSMISTASQNKINPELKPSITLEVEKNSKLPLTNNVPVKPKISKTDFRTQRIIPKKEPPSKIGKPVKSIGSSLSVTKDVHKKIISMIPIIQKNCTKTEPFQLSHNIRNKFDGGSISRKSRTCVDLKTNGDDLSADDGKARPNSGRLTSRSSGMGIMELPGMQKHRFGEVPKYLKTPEKTSTDNVLTTKRKTYNNLKKKLCECQTEFLQAHKAMQDTHSKSSKNTGKEIVKAEVIELVAVNIDDGKLLLVNDGCESLLKIDKKKLDHEIDVNKNIEIEQKLQSISETGYNLCKEFINSISKLKNDENPCDGKNAGDESTLIKWNPHLGEIVTKMEEKLESGLTNQQTTINEIIQMVGVTQTACMVGTIPKSTTKTIDHHEFIQLKKSLDVHKNKCNKLETNITELNKEILNIPDLQKQLKDKSVIINSRDHELQRVKALNKTLDEQKHCTEAKYQGIESKLIVKDMELKKTENELNLAMKRIKSCDDSMDEVKREKEKLYGYVCREQELSKLYDLERAKCEQLQQELLEKDKELNKAINDFDNHKKSTILGAGDRFEENQLWDEIRTIKLTLENTIKEKDAIEIQKNNLEKALSMNNNDSYKMELCKSNEEISHLQKTNEVLRESLNKMEQTVNRKCGIINDLEQKINNGTYLTNTSKEVQNELNILRETDAEKRREIEHLKCEVAKCHIEIKQQEETIYMHQRLLRIRSELINSLQEKEASNRCRMDDLYSEVTKKSTQVNQSDLQMNHEISAKAEELQNLFSTLGTKQMELTRQEHIIKMLEENNDRNQRLRVKQEEKICRLENEISELKNIICMYEETKPSLDFKKINADFLEHKSLNDLLVSRDLFHNERRKKRQIEIEVKKIKK